MNKCENIVREHLEKKGFEVKKLHKNLPDFLINNSYYVEVKNMESSYFLTQNQVHEFSKLKEDVFIYSLIKDNIVSISKFRSPIPIPTKTRSLNITFEDGDYAKLEKVKGDLGWREFILTLIKKGG